MAASELQTPMRAQDARERLVGFSFFTYGLGDDLELASTFYNTTIPASGRIAGSLGGKWTPLIAPEVSILGVRVGELRAIAGGEVPVALQGNEGVGLWVFSGISFRLLSTGTRFTVGPNYGTRQIFGTETFDAFWGVEQPLTKEWSLIADGYTGLHDLGATITAVQWDATPHLTLIAGPKWNTVGSRGFDAWMFEITYEAPL